MTRRKRKEGCGAGVRGPVAPPIGAAILVFLFLFLRGFSFVVFVAFVVGLTQAATKTEIAEGRTLSRHLLLRKRPTAATNAAHAWLQGGMARIGHLAAAGGEESKKVK
jgi:hypothetical protein